MSDLLNQASLVYIPSGYKEDTAYSVIPTDGSGDLTFTRASDGTRVNSSGYVENVPWNLYTYSEEFDNAAWVKNNCTISSNAIAAPNGTTTGDTLTETATSNFHICYQNTSITSGVVYTFSVYGKYNGRVMQLNLSSSYWGTQVYANFDLQNGVIGDIGTSTIDAQMVSVGNGWYRCSITGLSIATGTGGLAVSLAQSTTSPRNENYTGDGTSGVYIWGAQGVLGSTAKPYFPTTDRQNVPRLTYEGGCPSLLLEPQRTNLLTYSEQFDNAAWNKFNATITANATTSPDGTTSADKLIPNTVATSHQVNQSVTGAAHTISVFAKAGDYETLALFYTVHDGRAVFDLAGGTITEQTGTVTAKIEDYGLGWYRCSLSTTLTTHNAVRIYAINGTTWADVGVAGNGTSGLYIWGAQVEEGSYATSYIGPTTSAAVTRVVDTAYKTGATALIGQTEGTIFVEINAIDVTDSRVTISDGTSSNRLILRIHFNGKIQWEGVQGGTDEWNIESSIGTIVSGSTYKIAAAYGTNNVALYANGTQIGVDNSAVVTSALSILRFANAAGGTLYHWNQYTKQAVLFKTRLSNTELAALTTL